MAGLLLFAVALPFTAEPARADDPFLPEFSELAPGVWVGVRPSNPRFPVMGTTTFVVTSEGVIVFDGGGSPLYAERIIEKVRSITDRPVTHVVVSHWHGDHNFGIYRFVEEYPGVEIVAHSFTQAVFEGARIRYIDDYPDAVPGIKTQLEEALETGKTGTGEPLPDHLRTRYETMLKDADVIHQEFNRAKVQPATVTFDKKMVIHSGGRDIELLHLGTGNTAGDIVMWLADERIVAAGDIVVHPIPYTFNVDPGPWVKTLDALKALDYRILVTGHGELQYDTAYIDLLQETANGIAAQRDKLVAAGVEEEDAIKELDFSPYEERFTGGDPLMALFFDAWFKQPFSTSVFQALKGEPMVDPNTEG